MENYCIILIVLGALIAALIWLEYLRPDTPFYYNKNNDELPDDIEPIPQSPHYVQIVKVLPKVSHLLIEYRITYKLAMDALSRNQTPKAFALMGADGHLDWILLQKYLIHCEAQWYHLSNEFQVLQIDHHMMDLVKSSFYTSNPDAIVFEDDVSDLRFDIIANNHLTATFANGVPLHLPNNVITAPAFNGNTFGDYAPDDWWPPVHACTAITKSRNLLKEKLMGALECIEVKDFWQPQLDLSAVLV